MKKPWTRNQKLILCGILSATLIGILGWFVKIDIQLNYIQKEIKDIKINNANIKTLTVDEFLKTCPPGTSTSTIGFTEKGIRFGCVSPD